MSKTFTDYIREDLYSKTPDMRNVIIADKIKVQPYIENIIGKDSGIFDTRIWAGYSVDEAMANIKIPCVIKANNAWRRMKFINTPADITKKLRDEMEYYMVNIGKSWEWYYQKIKPGILIEQKLPDEHILYRVYVFGGVAKLYFIQRFDVSGKSGERWHVKTDSFHYANGDFIDVTWNKFPNERHVFPDGLCKKLNHMAEAIAQFPGGTPPYLRVDLYCIEGKLIFSELTMLPDGVTGHYDYFSDKRLDFEMGAWYREAAKK
jgi:hypothetical protein